MYATHDTECKWKVIFLLRRCDELMLLFNFNLHVHCIYVFVYWEIRMSGICCRIGNLYEMRVSSTPTISLAQQNTYSQKRQLATRKMGPFDLQRKIERTHPRKHMFSLFVGCIFFFLSLAILINSILPLVAYVLGEIEAIENCWIHSAAHCCGICLHTSDERSHTAAIVTCDERQKHRKRATKQRQRRRHILILFDCTQKFRLFLVLTWTTNRWWWWLSLYARACYTVQSHVVIFFSRSVLYSIQ